MSETVFTFSGKGGDAIHQWPVARQWAKQTGEKFTCWMDERTCKPVAPLFAAQPCVEKVEFKPGIVNYNCGGQPWHFDLPTSEFEGRQIFHLGLRKFPDRQLTLECFENSKVPVQYDAGEVARTPMFHVEPLVAEGRRCVLHGQSVYAHTKSSPGFWKFLASVEKELERDFDEVLWVGSERDREVGTRIYPQWKGFDDHGSFLELARLIAGAELVIGTGSSVVTVGGALKVPTVRVHDPIGDHAKRIWDNLAYNSINDTETELRKTWPVFRSEHLNKSKAEVVGG
jgi:hypothetical protein